MSDPNQPAPVVQRMRDEAYVDPAAPPTELDKQTMSKLVHEIRLHEEARMRRVVLEVLAEVQSRPAQPGQPSPPAMSLFPGLDSVAFHQGSQQPGIAYDVLEAQLAARLLLVLASKQESYDPLRSTDSDDLADQALAMARRVIQGLSARHEAVS